MPSGLIKVPSAGLRGGLWLITVMLAPVSIINFTSMPQICSFASHGEWSEKIFLHLVTFYCVNGVYQRSVKWFFWLHLLQVFSFPVRLLATPTARFQPHGTYSRMFSGVLVFQLYAVRSYFVHILYLPFLKLCPDLFATSRRLSSPKSGMSYRPSARSLFWFKNKFHPGRRNHSIQ